MSCLEYPEKLENDIDFHFHGSRLGSMLVCHCNGISDRTIRRVVREGAKSVAEVSRECGAGSCCSGCSPTIMRIIRVETRSETQTSLISTDASLASANS